MIAFISFLYGCSPAAGIYSRMSDPDKIIHDYEWFHTAHARRSARVAQVSTTRLIVESEQDAVERRRLRVELAGQQQSCRELTADYNANAEKLTMGTFRSWSLPAHLSPEDCE